MQQAPADEPTTVTKDEASVSGAAALPPEVLALVIAWSSAEAWRAGEVAVMPTGRSPVTFSMGRGASPADDPNARLEFARHRPGVLEARPALTSATLSRQQLLVTVRGTESLAIKNVGRPRLAHNGVLVDAAKVVPGDTLRVGSDLVLLCVKRPAWLPSLGSGAPRMEFGAADPHGAVGESPAAWELRRRIAFLAPTPGHVLVTGESGTGKEHTARALHALSPRANSPLFTRNAATLPEGLVDAELFGHARNYPNAGMPERPGLIATAAGATLFLDEIADLPPALQTHLLRVLDSGEYQRLGESHVRTADFRLVAATNCPERMRADLAARFKATLRVPGLNDRREDIPLLLIHLLRTIARTSPAVAERLFPDGDPGTEPRVSAHFVEKLVRHAYATHVRELERFVWQALAEGSGRFLDGPVAEVSIQRSAASAPPSAPSPTRVKDVSAEAIRHALAQNDGSVELAWRALGLASRHVLTRLIAKHGIRRPTDGGGSPRD